MNNCDFCNDFSCNNKYQLIDHLKSHESKIPKKELNQYINSLKKEKENCYYCNNKMSSYYVFQRHLKKCNYDQLERDLEVQISQIQNPTVVDNLIKKLHRHKSTLTGKDEPSGTNITHNNEGASRCSFVNNCNQPTVYQNNNDINININNFGQETCKMLHDTDTIKNEILNILGHHDNNPIASLRKFNEQNIKSALLKTFEEIHCNQKYPQNHNIYIVNKKTYRPFHVYVQDKWQQVGSMRTIQELIIKTKDIFLQWMAEDVIPGEVLSHPEKRKEFQEYLEILKGDLDNLINENLDEDQLSGETKKLRKVFFHRIYENRDLIKGMYDKTN